MRVVLDTSVIVSGFLSDRGAPRALLNLARTESLDLVTAPALLDELEHVLQQFLHRAVAGEARVAIEEIAHVVAPRVARAVSDDAHVDHVLAVAVLGRAAYLITRNRDLLAMREHGGVTILEAPPALDRIRTEVKVEEG